MDHNVETTTFEDFDNRPLKKAKCCETSVLDDLLSSPSISASSLLSECSETKSTLSPVSDLVNEEKLSEDDDKQTVSANDGKQPDVPQHTNDGTYDYLPQDYALIELDLCAHIVIEDSSEKEILVKIDQVCVKQCDLRCLLDGAKWLNDDVINSYIYCIKEVHEQNKNDHKVYFENTFLAGLLKRDGKIGIHEATFMTKIVGNYLKHDMIHLPINIEHSHWNLACVNVEKSEIQVLDSLCWEHNRIDLTNTLQGLQYHLDILKTQENMNNHNWKDLDVTKRMIKEQLHNPIQKDSSSCGLFMLKFMEYWTGHTLTHSITQENIIDFRYKLATILLCWKTNTAQGDPNDVVLLESLDDKNQPKPINSLSIEKRYQSLICVVSYMSVDELEGGLYNYIKSISPAEILEKVWVQSSDPYPISLTLKRLQGMLNEELPMECDCFSLVIRKIMFDDIQTVKKRKGLISKHYLDMRFWMITDFGRHPTYRKKLDVEQLAYSVRSWPGIKYNVSSCKTVRPLAYTCQHNFFNLHLISSLIQIHIRIQANNGFILFVLSKDTRTVYILDPTPTDPVYQRNPYAKYVPKLLWISEHLPKAMSKACPRSTWNENIFLWHQQIISNIPIHNRELSGYLITLFMSTWDDEKLNLPFLKDGYELRKQILGKLLTFKKNECEVNMPAGVLDIINCIRNIQTNMNVKI
ncbi:hypothetical protein BRADI_1g22390v3 [Brachypodium distachyon]|uniref:Ubiquitin-like protease family profile domain-containing protein n=1 Tax=Brachypodium distachyon TaxID=15368 RepID=A0A0Q3GWK8_BRADI|nr:hypothetical protein BRADI_1g22390v3 [Brachypodium distachyon]